MAQQPGTYTLPAREYPWWNTRSGELELLQLPAVTISVSGEAPLADAAAPSRLNARTLAVAGLATVALMLLWWGRRRLASLWQRLGGIYLRARKQWRRWREPALPRRLNPGNSAAD